MNLNEKCITLKDKDDTLYISSLSFNVMTNKNTSIVKESLIFIDNLLAKLI